MMSAVLRLTPVVPISREELEAATMHVESVLAEHTNSITEGASASANFADCSIEIDLMLDGSSVGELHEKLAQVITQLEQHSEFNIAPRPAVADLVGPALVVRSTATQVAAPPRDLVSA
jgi:type II secretory pathway component PulF